MNPELIEALQKYGHLLGALEANDREAVRAIVEHGVTDIDIRTKWERENFIRHGYRIPWNIQGKTALEKAIEWRDLDLVRLLIAKGAKI